jgi:hypothetical protein
MGPYDKTQYQSEYTSFEIEFMHLTCQDCSLNCYRYNPSGPSNLLWKPWKPKNEQEKQPYNNKAKAFLGFILDK